METIINLKFLNHPWYHHKYKTFRDRFLKDVKDLYTGKYKILPGKIKARPKTWRNICVRRLEDSVMSKCQFSLIWYIDLMQSQAKSQQEVICCKGNAEVLEESKQLLKRRMLENLHYLRLQVVLYSYIIKAMWYWFK